MRSQLRWWAVRAIAIFGGVYVLGWFDVPTLIPYIAALLVVMGDLARTRRAVRRR